MNSLLLMEFNWLSEIYLNEISFFGINQTLQRRSSKLHSKIDYKNILDNLDKIDKRYNCSNTELFICLI